MKFSIQNYLFVLSSMSAASFDPGHGPAFAAAAGSSSKLRGSTSDVEHRPHRVLESDTIGTFLIADIQYEDGVATGSRNLQGASGGNRPEKTYNVELPDGQVYELKNLPPAFSFDGLVSGSSFVTLPSGTELFSNGQANVHGVAPGVLGEIFDRKLGEITKMTTKQQDEARAELNRQLQKGSRDVLAVRVVLSDGAPTFNEAFLSDSVFGTSGDPVNLASQYAACSHNKLTFVKAADKSANNVTISDGVVTITLPNISKAQGDSVVRNAVTSALTDTFGTASGLADHVMYCLPDGTMSGIAYAYINSWNSVYSNLWCTYPSGQMHEIGHNLGYAHSNEGTTTYADQQGMMGYSYSSDDGPTMCFNGAKSSQTGWYADKEKVININSATDCFQGDLHGIVDYPTASTVLLKFVDENVQYHVNFNAKKGFNSGTREAGNQVTVTTRSVGSGYAESTLVAKLNAGGTYSTTNYSVTVNSINTTNFVAQVTVLPDGMSSCVVTSAPTKKPTTAAPTRSPTGAPSNIPTSSPTEHPTATPTTGAPSKAPSRSPSATPTSAAPTKVPSSAPSIPPSLSVSPSLAPTASPTAVPTAPPSTKPTSVPTTSAPSKSPTSSPTDSPTKFLCSSLDDNKKACLAAGCDFSNKNKTCTGTGNPIDGKCEDCSIFRSGNECRNCGNCSWSGRFKTCS